MTGLEPVGESRSKMAAMSLILLCCPGFPLAAALAASMASSFGLLPAFMLTFVGDRGGALGMPGGETFPGPGEEEGALGMPGEGGVALGREDFLTGDKGVGLEFFLVTISFPAFCSCFFAVAFSVLFSSSSLLMLLVSLGVPGLSCLPQTATRAFTLTSSSSLFDALPLRAWPGLCRGSASGFITGLADEEFFLGGLDRDSPELEC